MFCYAKSMTNNDSNICFSAKPYVLNGVWILRLPESASKKLNSRGQVAVTGSLDGHNFQTVLEPDGYWGHWMRIDVDLLGNVHALNDGGMVGVEITPTKKWPEPDVPQDFAKALSDAPRNILEIWNNITPMARWEWVRWVNATANADTRKRRIEVSISKMQNGKRRPCCFNLSACTDPLLSKNARLIEPS